MNTPGGFLSDTSIFDQLTPEKRKQVREGKRGGVLVRASPVEPIGGRRQYVAEMVSQDGTKIVYLRMATANALSDEDYVGMAQQIRDRMRAAESGE